MGLRVPSPFEETQQFNNLCDVGEDDDDTVQRLESCFNRNSGSLSRQGTTNIGNVYQKGRWEVKK